MLKYSNPLSIKANRESGGLVFRNPKTGLFYVSTPILDGLHSFNFSLVPRPAGIEIVGAYHSHGDYGLEDSTRTDKAGSEYNDDSFSDADKSLAEGDAIGSVMYLGTPSGALRRYDGATHQDTRIN
ncbi:MAG: DUF4329 domain-containing protein [Burkholderiaceae bacterium]|jgi:hypothetical protein|nr:DUF4329 domain-containing protein [Burkholderiaceae bacterium]